jgi:hypothetical protein
MEEFLKTGYEPFSDLMTLEKFSKKINSLDDEERTNFLRASLVYQQAINCKECTKDVSMSLLCSAVEVISGGRSILFKDWLIHNYIQKLSAKTEKEIKKILNEAFEEYTKSVEKREGISYNFKKFLIDNCPDHLKKPPANLYSEEGNVFEATINAIYSKFRCKYLHKGLCYLGAADDLIDKEKSRGGRIGSISFPMVFETSNKYVSIELTKITDWFIDVVKNSLYNFLTSKSNII